MLVWTILMLCVVASTADSTKSFLGEIPMAPELPTVIPAGSQLPARIQAPDVPSSYQAPVTITSAPVTTTTPAPVTITTVPVTTTNPAPVTTTLPPVPPKPYFNRTLHLRVELSVPASDYTEAYDVEYHAESNTARTTVNNYTIYRGPTGDGKVQYIKIELTRQLGSPTRYCTQSPALPASPVDSIFPGLPDLQPFDFVGYKTEEGRNVEHWQHMMIGGPGEIGAASGESLNYTHDLFAYRDEGDAVPLKYTVITDSSVLGLADTYTHRYTLLPPPTSPLLPDRGLCDVVMDYKPGMPRRKHDSLTLGKA